MARRGPICTFCEEKLSSGSPFCAKCGHPTQWATHDDRVLWELGQWETSRRSDPVQRQQGARAASSATRTQALADNVRERAQTEPDSKNETNGHSNGTSGKRSIMSRFRKVAPPDAAPAQQATPPAPRRVEPPAPRVDQPAPRRVEPPAQRPAARPAAQARPAAPQQPARPAAASVKPRPAPAPVAERPAPPKPAVAAKAPAAPAAKPPVAPAAKAPAAPIVSTGRSVAAAAAAPVVAPPAAKPSAEQSPLVLVRKPVGNRTAAPAPARPAPAPSAPATSSAPTAPARPAPQPAPKAPPRPAPQARPAPVKPPVDEKKRRKEEEEKRRKDDEKKRQKEASKRERKHKRHSKRVSKRAVSLDLKEGERVSLSIEGWSRFRRATLVVTNYRVALITRVPPVVRWIPLEEVGTVAHKWLGAHSLVIAAPAEVLTLQKRKKDMLASFQQLLESEVQESRAHGSARHHGDITQEWMEHASGVWDSHHKRLRLWIRRHPIVAFVGFVSCVAGAFIFTTWLTSVFSSVGG